MRQFIKVKRDRKIVVFDVHKMVGDVSCNDGSREF